MVLLKWSKLNRAVANLDFWDFELSEEDIAAIAGLDRSDGKTLPHPDELDDQ